MITALFLIGFIALVIAIGLAYTAKAPVGYEDDRGFHYGCADKGSNNFPEIIAVSLQDFPEEDETVGASTPFRIQWENPAWGLAALCMMLLVLNTETLEKNKKLIVSSQNNTLTQRRLASKNFSQTATIIAHNESSKFIQTLCQRFNQVE